MSLPTKLTEVEAFRAQVLLEESLKKLNFLKIISSSASSHGDELTQFMGDEISRIIQEQRDLERRYEELIQARSQLKGLSNKAAFKETQAEIANVAGRLKESNKSLCRNLRENPNVQGNLIKLQEERSRVQEWLEDTKSDLMDHEISFQNLVTKVENEKREQEKLNEVRKKEKEASQTVKRLEDEMKQQISDNAKETELADREIKELKEDLQKNKTISEIEFKFEEKKLRAREEALLRIHAQMEKKLQEELEELQEAESMETKVHESAHSYLLQKEEQLKDKRDQWQKDAEQETAQRKAELERLKEERETAWEQLKELEDKRNKEAEEHRQKENEMRNAVLIEKQRRGQLLRMAEAVEFLQQEGRMYIERMNARKQAAKGKKGKKGKKKA